MNCPDCKRAKVSQDIKLQVKREVLTCPDCGGMYIEGAWYSAPKYPSNDCGYLKLMGTERISRAIKVNGVWKNMMCFFL